VWMRNGLICWPSQMMRSSCGGRDGVRHAHDERRGPPSGEAGGGVRGQWAISVFSASEQTKAEICRAAEIPHPKIRVSTVGEVRRLGYDVVPTDAFHADLRLDRQPDEETWERLRSAFGAPERNPGLEEDDA
jgi:hypothetical protein